jgi:hypothetical protein
MMREEKQMMYATITKQVKEVEEKQNLERRV